MAHFAQLDDNNEVVNVVVIKNSEILDENGEESEAKGIAFCETLYGGRWIQTSYNSNFRKRYGGVGTTYLEDFDMFVPPKPFTSWILNTNTGDWEPPVPFPEEHGKWRPETKDYIHYDWNETEQKWENPTSTLGM